MKRLLLLSLCCAAIIASGCAPAPLTRADVDGRVICDVDQMDRIEQAARRGFKGVQWVNCPKAVLRAM